MRQAGAHHDQRESRLADLVAGGAQRGHVVGAEVLHLVDEDRHAAPDVAGQPADVAQQLDQVDLDVTGVRPAAHDRRVDARVPLVLEPRSGPGVALGEGADHAEHLVGVVGSRVPELAHRLVQRRRERSAQPLVGAGLELAGAPLAADGGGAQRVEEHGLAHAAQAGEDQRPLGPAPLDPLQHHVERAELLVPPGQLGRPLPRAGGVRVADRIHARTVSGCLADSLD